MKLALRSTRAGCCLILLALAVRGQAPVSNQPMSNQKAAPLPAVERPGSLPRVEKPAPPATAQPETPAPNAAPKAASPKQEGASPAGTGTPDAEGTNPDSSKFSTPSAAVLPKDRRAPYIIGPEDVLLIRVWDQPNLSGQVSVGPDGMISLQLIDEVKADGLTPEQLKGVLGERLKAFIVNPDVNVQVIRVNSRKFILQGEVNRPGSFPLVGPTTVMEALVFGGGFQSFANTKKIYILRTEINPATKKPETKKIMFNYKEVSHGKHMEQNILVNNGDQIFVP